MNEGLDLLIAQLDALNARLPELILKNTEVAALDALGESTERIIQTGIAASGQAFQDYTPNYKKAKTKKGRYRGHVDFQDTTQMLAGTTTGFERIGPTEKTISNGRARVSFDGRDDLTRKKLAGNNKTRPGFLNPNAEELKMVQIAANTNMERDIAEIVTVK